MLFLIMGSACGDNATSAIDAGPDMGGLGTKCDDNVDNDGDGLVDYPEDPGCVAPQADDETDDCPDGPGCPQCGNDRDDDGNGVTDFPNDPGCTSAADTTEVIENPVACGASMMIKNLPATGMDSGTLDGNSTSQISSPCGGGNGAAAIAYRVNLGMPTVIVASTAGSTFDTVLDLRAADCDDPAAEIACHDDVSGSNESSRLERSLPAGNYFLIVSGADTTELGAYTLSVERFAGEGSPCSGSAMCGAGLVCRTPLGGSVNVCTPPQCGDALDDDMDGKNGYPTDPGCGSLTDNDETDPNPLPACANGLDDDNDGMMDYPADTSCTFAGGTSEACNGEMDPIGAITMGTTNGTLIGARDDRTLSCSGSGGLDLLYTLRVPAMRSIQIDTEGTTTDTALALYPPSCLAPSLACDDDGGTSAGASRITQNNLAAATYIVAVENFSTSFPPGPFVIRVHGVIAPGGSCNPTDTLGGALACPAANPCEGAAGSQRCRPSLCGDGMDNDNDTIVDYPMDPGCSSSEDNDEGDTCASGPGPGCPECADGIDNDGDTDVDEDDAACVTPGTVSEGCSSTDGVRPLTMVTTSDDTTGDNNDVSPACGSSTNTAPDHTYALELPAMRQITIATDNDFDFDAVAALYNSTCGGTAIACTDSSPETISLTNVAAGNYFFVYDGYSSGAGDYSITVDGIIQNGASCESPLALSGAIRCGSGFACKGTAGARRCLLAICNDGVDNDMPPDGIADFPNDPGCASRDDDDEADACPGAGCSECSDGVDNDMDGNIDYPDDPQCSAASSVSEACASSDGVTPLVLAVTPGTNVGAANDNPAPDCGTTPNTAGDRLYSITVPALDSLEIANANSFDAAVALYDGTCGGTSLVCDDEPEDLLVTNLAAGTYYYEVDGYSSGEGAYTITISGVISTGASCEGPLVMAGVLECNPASTCAGTAGSRTCQAVQCSDGLDNDAVADGKIDFPFDPGCDTPFDTDETDPAVLPVCSNTADDDLDLQVDFPPTSAARRPPGRRKHSARWRWTLRPRSRLRQRTEPPRVR
ncbi:MAG: PPC domain-containing protein [Kofleriaceae bacterium]